MKDWPTLPATAGEWDCLPLRPAAVAALRERGIIPEPLRRDSLDWATPGGWAVTGEVRGADGQVRRWIYRYSGNALRPVLLWQDPSGQARRIFSAAVIQHTGLQQQTLAGLRLEPLMGLDARPDGQNSGRTEPSALVPGLEALETLAGEVHRYGGWVVQDDVLPPALTRAVLRSSVDFSRDAATPAGAAYALLSGDAAPLGALLRSELSAGVDQSRLAHGLRDRQYVDWRPLLDLPEGQALARRAQTLAKGSPEGLGLGATQAELAARALGFGTAEALKPENAAAMHAACLLLLSWRMGLPGLTFLSPQDLTGALSPRAAASGASGARSVPLWGENAHANVQGPSTEGPCLLVRAQAQKGFIRAHAGSIFASFSRCVCRFLPVGTACCCRGLRFRQQIQRCHRGGTGRNLPHSAPPCALPGACRRPRHRRHRQPARQAAVNHRPWPRHTEGIKKAPAIEPGPF